MLAFRGGLAAKRRPPENLRLASIQPGAGSSRSHAAFDIVTTVTTWQSCRRFHVIFGPTGRFAAVKVAQPEDSDAAYFGSFGAFLSFSSVGSSTSTTGGKPLSCRQNSYHSGT